MESEQLYHRGYCRNSYNSIASASSDEELLDGAGVIMDFHTTEDDNLLDGDAASPGTTFGHPACFVLWSRNLFRSEFSRVMPLSRVCMVFYYHLIFCIQSLFPLPVLTCSWLIEKDTLRRCERRSVELSSSLNMNSLFWLKTFEVYWIVFSWMYNTHCTQLVKEQTSVYMHMKTHFFAIISHTQIRSKAHI